MTLLIISPDYASHLLPLATLGTAWRDAGERVVVATGPATADIVAVVRVRARGPAAGPRLQPRRHPRGPAAPRRGRRAARVLRRDPSRHAGDPAVPGPGPRQRPVVEPGGDRRPGPADCRAAAPRRRDRRPPRVQRAAGSDQRRHPTRRRGPGAPVSAAGRRRGVRLPDRVAAGVHTRTGRPGRPDGGCAKRSGTISPRNGTTRSTSSTRRRLQARTRSPRPATCCCSTTRPPCTTRAVRDCSPRTPSWVPPYARNRSTTRSRPGSRPTAGQSSTSASAASCPYAATCWRGWPRPCAVSTYARRSRRAQLPRHELGELPSSWLVRDFLPQVTLLRHAALAVSHGGNNSVTEAMTAAVPLLLLPFSTDQFAGAAAVEAAGFGAALDPNTASVEELRTAASGLLDLVGRSARPIGAAERFADGLPRTPAGVRGPASVARLRQCPVRAARRRPRRPFGACGGGDHQPALAVRGAAVLADRDRVSRLSARGLRVDSEYAANARP